MGEWLDPLRSLIAIGLALLLVMLRLEAAQFSAAEYDESTDGRPPSFRRRMAWYGLGIGLILSVLLMTNMNPSAANAIQALLYALATRLGAPGRNRYMLAMALILGIAGGWVTAVTGGIAAAFLGHAVTRFAVFLCTGHAGQF